MHSNTFKLGLIGKKLTHSFSAKYFQSKFENEKLPNWSYDLIEIPNLLDIKNLIDHNAYIGFNVTIPYKEDIMSYCDALHPTALSIGAVNCIHIEDSQWIGYNFDGPAFLACLKSYAIKPKCKALILGAGGAAKAVNWACKEYQIQSTFCVRKVLQDALLFSELTPDLISTFDIIINTTPLGTFPEIDNYPPIPYEGIHPGQICIDLIYNPPITLFMNKCAAQGAQVHNGYDMLVNQAEMAWDVWNPK